MAQTTTPKIEELRFKLKSDPKSRLFFPLAEELRKLDQFDEAEQVLRNGLTHHPTYLSGWVSYGRTLAEQAKHREAIEALTKALQLDGGNVVAARLAADSYLALGEKIEAIKKYKLVHALLPADEELEAIIEKLDVEINGPRVTPAPAPAAQPSMAPTVTAAAAPAAVPQAAPLPPPPPPETPMAESPYDRTLDTPFPEASTADAGSPVSEASPWGDEEPHPEGTDDLSAAGAAPEESSWSDTPEAPPPPSPWSEPEGTGDEEPMSAAHDSSPFEEPVADSYSQAAFEVESPGGMQIESAPVAAEVPTVLGDEPSASDVAVGVDDPATTETMADLYVRQGLTDDARRIYESILLREPDNASVRAKLDAMTAPASSPAPSPAAAMGAANEKVARLERWLSRVKGREGDRV